MFSSSVKCVERSGINNGSTGCSLQIGACNNQIPLGKTFNCTDILRQITAVYSEHVISRQGTVKLSQKFDSGRTHITKAGNILHTIQIYHPPIFVFSVSWIFFLGRWRFRNVKGITLNWRRFRFVRSRKLIDLFDKCLVSCCTMRKSQFTL